MCEYCAISTQEPWLIWIEYQFINFCRTQYVGLAIFPINGYTLCSVFSHHCLIFKWSKLTFPCTCKRFLLHGHSAFNFFFCECLTQLSNNGFRSHVECSNYWRIQRIDVNGPNPVMQSFLRICHIGTCRRIWSWFASYSIRHNHATPVCFVDDALFCHCHSTHGGLYQHSVLMCKFIGQCNKF